MINAESTQKLEKILFKRTGKHFSPAEIEEAYIETMNFAYALMDLDERPN